MLQTFERESIHITDVNVVQENDGYYTIVTYSDGNYDEFGPYISYTDAKSAVY
jgi:hypothetical protein